MGSRVPGGIEVRHRQGCPAGETDGKSSRCRCTPRYRAVVWLGRGRGGRVTKTFSTAEEAELWRIDTLARSRRGAVVSPSLITVGEAAEALVEGMRAGTVRNRAGDPYKPSVVRSYEESLARHVIPSLGARRLTDVHLKDLQALVGRMLADGKSPSTIRNAINPVRVIYREALRSGELVVNPTVGLAIPAVRGRRERVASPQEAAALIAAVPEDDRVFWGLAFYAGLRVGEILDLSWGEVNLGSGVLWVRDAWDPKQKVTVEPKSRAGKRRVPIAGVLRQILIDHRLRHGEEGDVVLERRYWRILRRARRAWKAAGLAPIRPHECRHTFASLMIAAGVNPKALAAYMGHSSVRTTYDLYGHLMPGSEKEVADLLDSYLRLSDDRARASAPQTAPQIGRKSADLQGESR